jgi:hypothetical protein
VIVEPVIGRAAVRLNMSPALRERLAALAAGRPLVIDYYASRLRGVATGDLIVWFGEPAAEPCYLELEPIDGVVILVERHLVEILERATLRENGPSVAPPPGGLDRPTGGLDRLPRSTPNSTALKAMRRHFDFPSMRPAGEPSQEAARRSSSADQIL